MNNQEAKFILNGYRPGGRDAGDARFAEALQQAQNDPALRVWLGRTQAHDAAVTAKLREIAPPPGLREAILAGARVSRAAAPGWRRPVWLGLAAAAGVLLAVTAGLWPRRAEAKPDVLASFALVDALEGAAHGGHGGPAAALQAELSKRDTRLGRRLPVEFAQLESTGCRTVSVGGRGVLEICFQREGKWFHCYIARCEDFPQLAATEAARFTSSGAITAVTWADGAHRFVVAGPEGREALARML